jgi:glycosyltransferase involved in cell wall biosynthesis
MRPHYDSNTGRPRRPGRPRRLSGASGAEPWYTVRMPKRVLQLLGPSTGGIRLHVAELAHGLPSHGWDVSVMGSHDVMRGVGRQDHTIEIPSQWKPYAYRPAGRRLAAIASEFDVLHVHGLKAARVAFTVDERPPTVLTVHNLVGGTQPRGLRNVLERLESSIVERADHLIVISDEIGRRFDDVVAEERRTFVLPASPRRQVQRSRDDVRAEYGIHPAAPLVTIVARHHRQKNLPMFLDAMALLVTEVPNLRALLVGDGPERSALEDRSRELGLDGVVVFAGHRPNPVDEMHAADVVALTSDWEGSPLVVAECLSVERPLATTAVGTVTRHLVDHESAMIAPVGDASAFAAAVGSLLADPVTARAIARAGHLVGASVFDSERLVAAVADVYDRMLGDIGA